jgi:HlyD family secretion protein
MTDPQRPGKEHAIGPTHVLPIAGWAVGHEAPGVAASTGMQEPPPQSAVQNHPSDGSQVHAVAVQPCDGSQTKPGPHTSAFWVRAQPGGGVLQARASSAASVRLEEALMLESEPPSLPPSVPDPPSSVPMPLVPAGAAVLGTEPVLETEPMLETEPLLETEPVLAALDPADVLPDVPSDPPVRPPHAIRGASRTNTRVRTVTGTLHSTTVSPAQILSRKPPAERIGSRPENGRPCPPLRHARSNDGQRARSCNHRWPMVRLALLERVLERGVRRCPSRAREAMKARKGVALLLGVTIAIVGIWSVSTGRLGRKSVASNLLILYGNVDIRQVELGFRVAGRIQQMQLEEGQSVNAGAPMAVLDPRTFEDELRADRADVDAQDANLQKLIAGSRPAEIARGKAAVDEAKAAQDNARLELRRAERLVNDGTLSRSNCDNAVSTSRQADARVASAADSLRLLVQGTRAEDIAAARATLALARARLASAQTALDDSRLIAPSDGVVISRVREPGAIVAPNDIVYVLSLTHSVWVRAYVAETELGRIHPGSHVEVSSDSAPSHRYRGHVGFISPTAEFTPKSVETPDLRTDLVYRLRVIVDEPDPGLRQGMPVTLQITTGEG